MPITFGPQAGADTAAVWGQITGTLIDQTDLQTALDAKLATASLGAGVQTALGLAVLANGGLLKEGSAIGATTPAAGTFTTIGTTGRITVTNNAEGVKIQHAADTSDFISVNWDVLSLYQNNASKFRVDTTDNGGNARLQLSSDYGLAFHSGTSLDSGSNDTIMTRAAAGVFNLSALSTSVQVLAGAGAVDIITGTTRFESTGVGDALTLANGVAGQVKTIVHEIDGGSGVLTPTTKTGFTTITFTNVGDSCQLQYFATRGWMIISLHGAVAA